MCLCVCSGVHGESFHTPPVSPHGDGPALRPLQPSSPQPSSAAPLTSPPPVPLIREKKAESGIVPSASSPRRDWKPHPPVGSASLSSEPAVTLVHSKAKGQAVFGRNGGPLTSTPRAEVSQEEPLAISPSRSPPKSPPKSSSTCCSSSGQGSCSGQGGAEWDSGLSRSSLPDSGELEKLLKECKATLGITTSQDVAPSTAGKSQTSAVINESRISLPRDFYLVFRGILFPAWRKAKCFSVTFLFLFDMLLVSSDVPSEILKLLQTEVKSLKTNLQVR